MSNRKRVAKINTKINTKSKRSKVMIANKCIFVFTWVCLPTSALGITFMPIKRNVPLIRGWAKIQERIQFMKGRWDFFTHLSLPLFPFFQNDFPEWNRRTPRVLTEKQLWNHILVSGWYKFQEIQNTAYPCWIWMLNVPAVEIDVPTYPLISVGSRMTAINWI